MAYARKKNTERTRRKSSRARKLSRGQFTVQKKKSSRTQRKLEVQKARAYANCSVSRTLSQSFRARSRTLFYNKCHLAYATSSFAHAIAYASSNLAYALRPNIQTLIIIYLCHNNCCAQAFDYVMSQYFHQTEVIE